MVYLNMKKNDDETEINNFVKYFWFLDVATNVGGKFLDRQKRINTNKNNNNHKN